MEVKPTYEQLEEKLALYSRVLKSLLPEKSGAYFICGEAGNHDDIGLPERILVCPTFGLDGFAVYKKESNYSAPEW